MNGQSPDRVERHVVLHDRRDEVDAAQSDLFDTLASLGYGDIIPAIPLTRTLAYLEAIAGTFYLAIVVASLIGARKHRTPH